MITVVAAVSESGARRVRLTTANGLIVFEPHYWLTCKSRCRCGWLSSHQRLPRGGRGAFCCWGS